MKPSHSRNVPPQVGAVIVPKPILQRAHELINGDRAAEYGPASESFQAIADLWSTWLSFKYKQDIALTGDDVASMMINLKQIRLAQNPMHRDSQVDIAGYAGLMGVIQGTP